MKQYPFSMEKNAHNFFLVSNVCANRMYDMQSGDIPFDRAEYERLDALKRKADRFMSLGRGVVWVDGRTLGEMREVSALAVEHRVNACIEAGREDLVKYC